MLISSRPHIPNNDEKCVGWVYVEPWGKAAVTLNLNLQFGLPYCQEKQIPKSSIAVWDASTYSRFRANKAVILSLFGALGKIPVCVNI